jgi:serine/threonine protein kinase/actin-like ATPase involved in cell morphogenesis
VREYSLGVDLGTTFVAAAIARGPKAEMVTLGDRSMATPAAVFLGEDGSVVTGDAASRRGTSVPDRTAREFKRRLGDPTPIMVGGEPRTPVELMAALLRDVRDRVAQVEGGDPAQVVLTHPANWGPFRRALFDEVPLLAGLPDTVTITEPEAAAAHYAATRQLEVGSIIAVYDLGGGTFDVTVLRQGAEGIEILGVPEGIERLGGIDFDEAILNYVNHVSGGALHELDPRDPQVVLALSRLRQDCVLAKETLSLDTETVVPVFLPGRHFDVEITRTRFEELVRAQIESTVGELSRTLRSAQVSPSELSAVLLVGGSSRIPLVARMVSEELGRPTVVDAHPKYAVALGAATIARAIGERRPSRPAAPPGDTGPTRDSVVAPTPAAPAPSPGPDRAQPKAGPGPLGPTITLGQQLGPYRIDRLIGRGETSEVFQAYHIEQDRVVALKLMLDGLSGNNEFRRRFLRESQVTARLGNPHIVPIHNWGDIGGRLYLDMRYVEGEDLASRLGRSGALTPADAVDVLAQLARALDAAHREGLVHRDVRPSNVLVASDQGGDEVFVYLLDFGIVRALSEDSSSAMTSLTLTGTALGSLDYMAPERFLDEPVDRRADVYSLGCVLYQALTGERPFPVEGMALAMQAHLSAPVPRPSVRRAEVPAALDAVVERAMAKHPDQRFATAGELAAAARGALTRAAPPLGQTAGPRGGPPARGPGAGAPPLRRPTGQHPPQGPPPVQPQSQSQVREPAAPGPVDRNAPTVRPPRRVTASDLPTVRPANPPTMLNPPSAAKAPTAGEAPARSGRFTGAAWLAKLSGGSWTTWLLPVAVVVSVLLVLAGFLLR